MITVTVSGKVKPQFKQTFIEHMAALAPIVRAEEGCIVYQQNQSVDDETMLFLFEQWQSESLWQAHLATEHMQQHLAQARPWFDWVEMTAFDSKPLAI